MSIRFLIFALIILGIFLGSHLLLYYSLVQFYNLDGLYRLVLFVFLMTMSFSFIISSLLAHWRENLFTKYFYFFNSFWLGLMVKILMALFVSWLLFLIASIFNWPVDIAIASTLFFVLALVFALYGVHNAFNLEVNNIEVKLKNLPTVWQGKKIVQISDLHLGIIHGVKFLDRVINKVNSLEPDIIFITGDLFDGMDVKIKHFIKPLNNFKAKQGIYFVEGNHEVYLKDKHPTKILDHTNIQVLDNEVIDINGLQILGISFPELGTSKKVNNLIKNRGDFYKNKATILLHHTPDNLETNNMSFDKQMTSHYWFPDVDFKIAKDLGINLQLSGHTHRGQIFPLNYLTWFMNKGYDYGLHTDGNFNIYVSSGVGTWGPPMRTGSKSEIVNITLK